MLEATKMQTIILYNNFLKIYSIINCNNEICCPFWLFFKFTLFLLNVSIRISWFCYKMNCHCCGGDYKKLSSNVFECNNSKHIYRMYEGNSIAYHRELYRNIERRDK